MNRLLWGRFAAAAFAVVLPISGSLFTDSPRPEESARLPDPTACCRAASPAEVEHVPGTVSAQGVGGTTTADLASFAVAFNAIRVENDLRPVPLSNFRYDACLEQRLFWIAEDPSSNITSAWGHVGSVRSDGVPSVGCDGNLAGGPDETGADVAIKWWNSVPHRMSLYKPPYADPMSRVCIAFAMTHGGVPDEPATLVRAAARWRAC